MNVMSVLTVLFSLNLIEVITVMSTEIIEEITDSKEDSPVPPDQAVQLLKIVEDHDKQEVILLTIS